MLRQVFTPGIEQDLSFKQSSILKFIGKLILGIVVFVIVVYWFFPQISAFFKWRVNVADASFVEGDGSVNVESKRSLYESVANQLNIALKTSYSTSFTAGPRCKAFERWMRELNLNEFRHCANIYKNSYRKTIREMLNETNWTGCGFVGTDYGQKFKERLDALGIP
jgi:hypothetical protein